MYLGLEIHKSQRDLWELTVESQRSPYFCPPLLSDLFPVTGCWFQKHSWWRYLPVLGPIEAKLQLGAGSIIAPSVLGSTRELSNTGPRLKKRFRIQVQEIELV